MKLADLRRLTIRKQVRIRFIGPDNLECVIDEHGLAKLPGLKVIPKFNLEEGLAEVTQFHVDSTDAAGKISSRKLSLPELEKLVASLSPAPIASADHDE